jgi:hypothetical protein
MKIMTSPTSGGRSVGIVRLRTKATELASYLMFLGSKVRRVRRADNLTTIYEPTV